MQNRCLKLFIHTITNPHFSLYMDILRSNIDFFLYQQNPNGLTKVTISGHGWQKYHRSQKKGKHCSLLFHIHIA